MPKYRTYNFGDSETAVMRRVAPPVESEKIKVHSLKNELMDIFQKHGYLSGSVDYEVKIKLTSVPLFSSSVVSAICP